MIIRSLHPGGRTIGSVVDVNVCVYLFIISTALLSPAGMKVTVVTSAAT
jgi:hypothetical protein